MVNYYIMNTNWQKVCFWQRRADMFAYTAFHKTGRVWKQFLLLSPFYKNHSAIHISLILLFKADLIGIVQFFLIFFRRAAKTIEIRNSKLDEIRKKTGDSRKLEVSKSHTIMELFLLRPFLVRYHRERYQGNIPELSV